MVGSINHPSARRAASCREGQSTSSLGTEGRTGREHLTFQFYYMGNHLLTSLNPGFYLQGYWTPGFFSVQHFFSRLLMDVVQHL